MATRETVALNEAHAPRENAIEAFNVVGDAIKNAIKRSRLDWDKHEPRMWQRAASLSNADLVAFNVERDLVLVRSGPTEYGTIIFGKLRIPAINDDKGEGFVHVRIHDSHNRGERQVHFHSILTEEGDKDEDGHPTSWNAVQTFDTSLDFFNE